MVRPRHGVAAGGTRDAPSVARVPAACERETDRRRLGPADAPIRPYPGEEAFIRCPEDGIFRAGPVLEARHRASVVLEPDLPEAGVAAEDRRVPAGGDVVVERVPHAPRPVLVVSDVQAHPMILQDLRVCLEVVRRGHVHPVAARLRPAQERPLPVPPPRAPAPIGQPERPRPVPIAHRLAVGRGLHHAADRLRLHQEPLRERTLERDAGAAGVEGRPAPVVVGIPRGGGEDQQDPGRLVCARPDHEAGVRAFRAGGERHRVVARTPRGIERDVDRGRPATAVRARPVGRGVCLHRDIAGAPDHRTLGAVPRDLDRAGADVARRMQPHRLPGRGRERPAIGVEHGPQSRERGPPGGGANDLRVVIAVFVCDLPRRDRRGVQAGPIRTAAP